MRRLLCGLLVVLVPGGALAAPAVAADTVTQVVGTGTVGYSGDGGPAAAAQINHPRGLVPTADGGFLIADAFGNVVRRVSAAGNISTAAGTGAQGFGGDGFQATSALLFFPHAVAQLADGGFLIDDTRNKRIRRVTPGGVISTVAGDGSFGFGGDGGPATSAQISDPRGMAGLPDGSYLIADTDNNRVRYVDTTGRITTVAGDGTRPATAAAATAECRSGPKSATSAPMIPFGISVLPGGGFLIVDTSNDCIRRVSAVTGGTITTVAGDGTSGFSGDNGPAVNAKLGGPHNVAPLADGGFLIADTGNQRVRRVAANGTITTIAGTGTPGSAGVGGDPLAVQLNAPKAVMAFAGGYLIADATNSRVLFVGSTSPFTTPPPVNPPVNPPVDPPVTAPVDQPVTAPVTPPVTPLVTPPVTPPVVPVGPGRVSISVVPNTLTLDRGRALMSLRCTLPAGQVCRGRLTLSARVPAGRTSVTIALGTKTFSIAGGTKRTVATTLSRTARRRLNAIATTKLKNVRATAKIKIGEVSRTYRPSVKRRRT